MIMEDGKVISFGTPKEAAEALAVEKNLIPSLPAGLRVWSELLRTGAYPPPINLGESRLMLENCFEKHKISGERAIRRPETETVIELKNMHFCYDKNKPDVICGANLNIRKGESYTLLGSNGSGKSTLLSVIAGIEKPYRGKVRINGKRYSGIVGELAVLPQDVRSTFLYDTVGEELEFTESAEIYDFRPYYEMHPYDLSGGQQQLLGMKKLLMSEPKMILLDEPTKGMDGSWREHIGDIILSLRERGMTILTVTHDMELAAQISDRCGIFFDGIIAAESEPEEIFRDSIFYTTNAVKTARGIYSGICTAQELTDLCRENGIKGEVG
jgi:energy-coupling factor transport system ATP-binding protein